MSSKKTKLSRKDPLKTPKVWERARREKMKIYFNELQEVLPFYDPSTPMSRFEILQKSKMCIKDLQDQNQDLLNGGFDEVYKSKMTKLKQRVKELLKRVDQLTDLLRAANIMIPPLEMYPEDLKNCSSLKWMNQRPKKWTEKINLVVPDEKIKNVLSLIKDYKKNSGKINSKKKLIGKGIKKIENFTSQPCPSEESEKSKKLKKNRETSSGKDDKNVSKYKNGDTFNESQSPSQYKENQPVDYNLLSVNNKIVSKDNNVNKENDNGGSGRSNDKDNNNDNDDNSVERNFSVPERENQNNTENKSAQVITLQPPVTNKIGISQQLMETQQNIVLPTATSVLQSNTFILTNDGSLVQLPILNSPGTVFDGNSNLIAPATIVKPNAGLLTPIVINKPAPVIVLQKPSPIIQAAQILNAAPQVISVSKSNVQILNSSVIYTSSNAIAGPKTLPHILSKAPANKKRIMRDSTTTTYVNKIPIAALSKHSYTKKSVPAGEKSKPSDVKGKEVAEKLSEVEIKGGGAEDQRHEQTTEKNVEPGTNEKTNLKTAGKDDYAEEEFVVENGRKRNSEGDERETNKKQKSKDNVDENLFKPIDNPIETDAMFCNLALPNSINPSLSVSPTAAFLSSFPIVAPARPETDDDVGEKKSDDGKGPKPNEVEAAGEGGGDKEDGGARSESTKARGSKEFPAKPSEGTGNATREKEMDAEGVASKNSTSISANGCVNVCGDRDNSRNAGTSNESQPRQQPETCKSWDQYQHHDNCEIRSDSFFMPSDQGIHMTQNETSSAADVNYTGIMSTNAGDLTYGKYGNSVEANASNVLGERVMLKSDGFDYSRKGNYVADGVSANYGAERSVPKKTTNAADSYGAAKSQAAAAANYDVDSGPIYHLIPAKEVMANNQRNSRTVNWMTEPDVRNGRSMVYCSQSDKMATSKAPLFAQTDNFYAQSSKMPTDCSASSSSLSSVHFDGNDLTKMNYHKNDFFGKDQQRCKGLEKQRSDPSKCYPAKIPQNSYNIFDYNYAGSCYGEIESNKYCSVQTYVQSKNKKSVSAGKKKAEGNVSNASDPGKRPPELMPTNVDFNAASGQECFTWMPGKNVDWLPGKSFGLDGNLVVPSTLPTLVGDLALGTTSANEIALVKNANSKVCQPNSKIPANDVGKEYLDLGMANVASKPMENVVDSNKQYLEPFANLSKNIFDTTPSSNVQVGKNDFPGSGNSETIILKNIFELPVSKSGGGSNSVVHPSDFNRQKQRNLGTSQNSFLSVSQLVEPPTFAGTSMKNENQLEPSAKSNLYGQNYPSYGNQKNFQKVKSRNSHCKYERKYQGYKNVGGGGGGGSSNNSSSSSYTAEALIRSNNINCHASNDYGIEINPNHGSFFNGKTSQKPGEQFASGKTDFEIAAKTDFQGPNQNFYGDFNFSSPVPNFGIGPTVGPTDFGNHPTDVNGNFGAQNNSFYGDFAAPADYPGLSENVSNPLLMPPPPPCSIALQSPFVGIEKRNFPADKGKNGNNPKQFSNPRNGRKHYECGKSTFNEFPIPPSGAIFTTAGTLSCPAIFTPSTCQNLLPVPSQSIPISFSSPSFTSGKISFPPPLPTTTNNNYQKLASHNSASGSFLPSESTAFPSSSSKPNSSSSQNCYPSGVGSNSVISSSFSVGNVPFSTCSQSAAMPPPFFSLSNPIVPSSAPTSSSNSLANFNLSTIFPEINQKGNYHYS